MEPVYHEGVVRPWLRLSAILPAQTLDLGSKRRDFRILLGQDTPEFFVIVRHDVS